MAEAPKEPTITEEYTAKLQELHANTQHAITQAFREHRETWNNILTYEQARWRWATEEQQYGPDTSFVGHGLHAVPMSPETALATSQAVQAAIQETAVAREAREAWLLEDGGTTREQLIHRGAYDLQHPPEERHHDTREAWEAYQENRTDEQPYAQAREALQTALWENYEAQDALLPHSAEARLDLQQEARGLLDALGDLNGSDLARIEIDTSQPAMEEGFQALLARLDARLEALEHGTDERQHQQEMGY